MYELRSVIAIFVQSLLVYAPDSQRVPPELASQWDQWITKAALRCLRARPSTSPSLLYAFPGVGGLGFPSCLAGALANRAREFLCSFAGTELQAQVRRAAWGRLRDGHVKPGTALQATIELLAERGFYIRDSQELFQSRVVAALARAQPWHASDALWRPRDADNRARRLFASTGALFAAIRHGLHQNPDSWQATYPLWWSAHLEWTNHRLGRSNLRNTGADVAAAVQEACREAKEDLYSEMRLFGVQVPAHLDRPQQWLYKNWTGEDSTSCPRARALNAPRRLPQEYAWGGSDGGATEDAAASAFVLAAVPQPIAFATGVTADGVVRLYRFLSRMPAAIGSRQCGVHEAEIAGLLACLAKALLGVPVGIAVDREALIDLANALPFRSRRDKVRANMLPWEDRLASVLVGRDAALSDTHPALPFPVPENLRPWRCSSTCKATLLIWVPSHQPDEEHRVPCNLCASLNDLADEDVTLARARDPPVSVRRPAGGSRFHLEHLGRTVIGDPAAYVRGCYASEATLHLTSLSVQGFMAQRNGSLWGHNLESWRAVLVPEGLRHLARELDPAWRAGDALDMHQHAFRLLHGIGGSYSSLVRRDASYKRIADTICDDLDPDGTCCLLWGG